MVQEFRRDDSKVFSTGAGEDCVDFARAPSLKHTKLSLIRALYQMC